MSAAFSPDDRYMLTTSRDGYAQIWDASSGRQLKSFSPGGIVLSAAFSPDGRRIVTGPGGGVWDVEAGRLIKDLHCDCALFDIEFSPDGGSVLAAVSDQTRIWSVPSTQGLIDQLKKFTQRCLTPNERRAVFLDPEPPAWCIDMEKWPYNTQDWKDWLRFKHANANPPLPDTPEWRSWPASNNRQPAHPMLQNAAPDAG